MEIEQTGCNILLRTGLTIRSNIVKSKDADYIFEELSIYI